MPLHTYAHACINIVCLEGKNAVILWGKLSLNHRIITLDPPKHDLLHTWPPTAGHGRTCHASCGMMGINQALRPLRYAAFCAHTNSSTLGLRFCQRAAWLSSAMPRQRWRQSGTSTGGSLLKAAGRELMTRRRVVQMSRHSAARLTHVADKRLC